jgi:hypothetical protein
VLAVSVDELVCARHRSGRLSCWGAGYGPEPVGVRLPADSE